MIFPNWYLSKKIIFLFDVCFTLLSLVLAYLIRFDFIDFYELFWIKEYQSVSWGVPTLLIVRVISFIIGNTHKGIIRFLSSDDTQRIVVTVTLGTLAVSIISLIRYYLLDQISLLPKSVIIIEYLGTLFFLLSYRFAIKMYYLSQLKSKGNENNVLIFGAGKMGLITKNTLERDENRQYNVIGFIDDDIKKEGLLIERKKIIHTSSFQSFIKDLQIDCVIIAIKDPLISNKRQLVDICLQHNIQIKSVPSLSDWYDGQFSAKQVKDIKIEDLLGRKPIELNNEQINNNIKDKVVLISGAAGSIGSEITRQVISYNPKKAILLDQAESALYDLDQSLKAMFNSRNWELVIGDITRQDRMERLFQHLQPEIVFHAAAYKHVPLMEDNPAESIRTNVQGTKILADLAVNYNVNKFIFISTDKAVNPTNIMGASKRIAEMYCQSIDDLSVTKFITTRFGNVLGSNGSVIPLFKRQLDAGGPITVTDENVTRYFMTIPEACQLVLEAFTMGDGGEIYVFDMGESIKIIDLAKKMIKLAGLKINEDIHIKITGLRPGEKMYEELLNKDENTSQTHHPKILIGKVNKLEYKDIKYSSDQLIFLTKSQKNEEIVKKMKEMVPEYISNNSEFSKFDA